MSDDFDRILRAGRPHTAADGDWANSPEGERALAAVRRRVRRPSRRPALYGVGLTAAAAVATTLAVTLSGAPRPAAPLAEGTSTAPVTRSPGAHPSDIQLVSYSDCGVALDQLRAHAERHLHAYQYLPYADYIRAPVASGAKVAYSSADSEPVPDHSTTNNQETGVDEPDIVETDGTRVVSVSGGVLRVVDTASRTVTGTLDLSLYAGADSAQLLLSGNRVLVILGSATPSYYAAYDRVAYDYYPQSPSSSGTAYLLVDISGAPKVISTLHPKGDFVDARMIDGTVRLVVDSRPRIAFPVLHGKHTAAQRRAANRAAVARTPLSAWQPSYDVTAGGTTTSRTVGCGDISHPAEYTGSSLLTVYTVDLAKDFGDVAPVSLAADAATVYASATSLYVADQNGTKKTHLHRFDISGQGKPVYLGSGTVSGNLLDAYSLSEYDGYLRAVTTDRPYGKHRSTSVYDLDADTLKVVGQVRGLGRGEDVHAVRFLGTLAYLVTYKQVDPLYVVDLSDPLHPKAAGELTVTGYSDYLHPVADGRLLGVGEDVNPNEVVDGLQVSLYDVSDTTDPRRVANIVRRHTPGESGVDPHAFLYWPATSTAVVPIDSWNSSQSGAVLVVHVGSKDLRTVGLIRNRRVTTIDDEYDAGIERSLYIGNSIWTMSTSGLKVSDGTTLAAQGWIPFG